MFHRLYRGSTGQSKKTLFPTFGRMKNDRKNWPRQARDKWREVYLNDDFRGTLRTGPGQVRTPFHLATDPTYLERCAADPALSHEDFSRFLSATNLATSMDECGSSHGVNKHALNLHSSKEIDVSADYYAVPSNHCTHWSSSTSRRSTESFAGTLSSNYSSRVWCRANRTLRSLVTK